MLLIILCDIYAVTACLIQTHHKINENRSYNNFLTAVMIIAL